MIIAGYEYRGTFPFKNVYFTGIVRDKLHRKMSKSLGNSPDPLDLIAKYGADGVRVGMLFCSPAGNDILFDEALTEQGRNFSSKIWNSFRLIKGWEIDPTIPQPEHSRLGIEWFKAKLSEVIVTMDDHFDKYRLNDALMTIYNTMCDEFSGLLLEIIKPAYQEPIDARTLGEVVELFDEVLRLLHPFMPFISEEIWHLLKEREHGDSIMISSWPKSTGYDENMIVKFEKEKEAIAGLRTIRTNYNIKSKDQIGIAVKVGEEGFSPDFNSVLVKMGNISTITETTDDIKNVPSFLVDSSTFFITTITTTTIAPSVNTTEAPITTITTTTIRPNIEEELKKLQAELDYYIGFLESVKKKTGNERFMNSAPAQVVELERKKQTDAEEKIKMLEERIVSFKSSVN
jgi:valyl-tRNA synthetase